MTTPTPPRDVLLLCPCGAPCSMPPYAMSSTLYRLDCERADCGWCTIGASPEMCITDWNRRADRIERALAVQGDGEEGCTPADARLLRKANHDLAQESFEFRTALTSLVQQIEAHAAQHGEGDFYTGDAVRLLSRTQEPR